MKTHLKSLYDANIISALDYQFAKFLGFNDLSYLIFALLSHANGLGHSFIGKDDLCRPHSWFNQSLFQAKHQVIYRSILEKLGLDLASTLPNADFSQQIEHLLNDIFMRQHEQFPVIYDPERGSLYLANHYYYEENIANFIQRSQQKKKIENDKDSRIGQLLQVLFPINNSDHENELDWQKVAACIALTQRVAIISGGPGTGKTTTVAKILAGLITLSDIPLRIELCAPTGKAAARLSQSMIEACEHTLKNMTLLDDLQYAQIPQTAKTIHRLLGIRPYSSDIKFNAQNLLPIDVLLIDEASMIDLAMMSQIISALPSHARLILLGDKDQLSSVESGSVLAQLCEHQQYSADNIKRLSTILGQDIAPFCEAGTRIYADYFCMLKKSYRFDSQSTIGRLARAVNQGELEICKDVLHPAQYIADHSVRLINPEINTGDVNARMADMENVILPHILDLYEPYLSALNAGAKSHISPQVMLEIFNRARVLCATRQDQCGSETINARLSSYCQSMMLSAGSNWFHGRPIMITENAYSLDLYNGDVGICLLDDQHVLSVYFESAQGIKKISPMRLPRHETAWAMTIHKSQGSEFNHIILVLPIIPSTVVSRELLYTGITRAKNSVLIISNTHSFNYAVSTKTRRHSNISSRITALMA